MDLCKSKQILNFCHPNALMTLKEFLVDYASPETRKIGKELIKRELFNVPNKKVRDVCEQHLNDIDKGQRDFHF